jgi:hypothetical protein
MTSMTLSQTTQDAITNAINNGPGSNNQNYVAAYNAIYNDIAANGEFNGGTLQWFNLAPTVNAQAFQPSAAGTFIWNYTMAAAATEGVTLTQWTCRRHQMRSRLKYSTISIRDDQPARQINDDEKRRPGWTPFVFACPPFFGLSSEAADDQPE